MNKSPKPCVSKAIKIQHDLDEQEHELTEILQFDKLKTNIRCASILPQCWFFVEKPETLEFIRIDPASKLIKNHLVLNEDLTFHIIYSNKKQQKLDKSITSPNEIYELLKSVEEWPLCVGTHMDKIEFSRNCKQFFIGDEVRERYTNKRCAPCGALRKKILNRKTFSTDRQLLAYKQYADNLDRKCKQIKKIICGQKKVRGQVKRTATPQASEKFKPIKLHKNQNNCQEISLTTSFGLPHQVEIFEQNDLWADEQKVTMSSLAEKPCNNKPISATHENIIVNSQQSDQHARITEVQPCGISIDQVMSIQPSPAQEVPKVPSDGNKSLTSSKKPSVPSRYIFGMNSVCKFCGFIGQDFSRCERCKHVFIEEPDSLPIDSVLVKNIKIEPKAALDDNDLTTP